MITGNDHVLDSQECRDFFISYTSNDQKWAEWIAIQLEAAGYTLFIRAWDFRPGSNLIVEMNNASRCAERTLIVLSSAYLASDYTLAEWAAAFRKDPKGKNGRVLPVRIQKCEIDGLLGSIVYIDLVGLDEQGAREKLLADIQPGRVRTTNVPFPDNLLTGDNAVIGTRDQPMRPLGKFSLSKFVSVPLNIVFQPQRSHSGYTIKSRIKAYKIFIVFISFLTVLPLFYFVFPKNSIQHSSPTSGEIQDQNLLLEFMDVVSPSFVIPNDPNHYIVNHTMPTSISAVLLSKNAASYYNIVIVVQNLRFGGADILIDGVALKLRHIPVTPRPLKIWTPGVSTTYNAYPYPVTYRGQSLDQLSDQLLYATPHQNVTLKPAKSNHAGESNQISINVMSKVTVYLQFQVQVFYQIADSTKIYTLMLPQTFQVVFSDGSNWQTYTLKNGLFLKKP